MLPTPGARGGGVEKKNNNNKKNKTHTSGTVLPTSSNVPHRRDEVHVRFADFSEEPRDTLRHVIIRSLRRRRRREGWS